MVNRAGAELDQIPVVFKCDLVKQVVLERPISSARLNRIEEEGLSAEQVVVGVEAHVHVSREAIGKVRRIEHDIHAVEEIVGPVNRGLAPHVKRVAENVRCPKEDSSGLQAAIPHAEVQATDRREGPAQPPGMTGGHVKVVPSRRVEIRKAEIQ
ncbi:MAG: hypothetical protein KIS67_02775 [Verrucomicrobiae bacterium]|nr:hypothetical protein [Verrucomicrobiae bacterium]